MNSNVSFVPSAREGVAYISLSFSLADYESALIKLTNAEVQIDDLKLQLDDALGAEEMLVQLTERNLELGEVGHLFIPFDVRSLLTLPT